ncbi:MAG: alpha-1,2-fucosyltransferase [Bacteroidota bacterium]
MIVVKIWGGLGNQMFQYAAAKALSVSNNVVLKLDTSHFENPPPGETTRSYRLHIFPNIREELATEQEIARLRPVFKTSVWNRLYKKINQQVYNFNKYYKTESGPASGPIQPADPSSAYLDGYWQSENYFVDHATVIRESFSLHQVSQNSSLQDLMARIHREQSVSVHIRRGDYVTSVATNAYHGVLGVDYYKNAIDGLQASVGHEPHFFIFSDDIDWCKNNLQITFPHTYVSTGEDFYDLYLMSICKHHIIANSSFSWWGAWLSASPDKQVIAPAKWFSKRDAGNIIPVSWTTK